MSLASLKRWLCSSMMPAFFLALASVMLPLAKTAEWSQLPLPFFGPIIVLMVAASLLHSRISLLQAAFLTFSGALFGCLLAIWWVHSSIISGNASWGFWCYVAAVGFLVWRSMSAFASTRCKQPILMKVFGILVPAIFGIWLVVLWELVVKGFGIPQILLPAPSVIGGVFAEFSPVLAADFNQTVIRSVIPGFLIGNTLGFLIAVIADRVVFLKRGLLPLGNLISAIPIVGIAPIMVMWFGFDWQSKAAVVVIMTFFPMLVNAIIGLSQSGNMELDLMRSYGAHYWQEFFRLRLPNALPFIFNALKINSTLALIGAIVAEFFGTPIVGMGFRISTEVGRMSLETVWATIAVAALTGSIFYGFLALLERKVTFWHASFQIKQN